MQRSGKDMKALYVKDYMLIMGYLFLKVSFQNANRAGEARNIDMQRVFRKESDGGQLLAGKCEPTQGLL